MMEIEGIGITTFPQFSESTPKWKKGIKEESIESELTSILDQTHSLSSSNSPSSLSSSFNRKVSGLEMEDLGRFSFGEASLLPWFVEETRDHLQSVNPLEFVGIQKSSMDNFNMVQSFSSDFSFSDSGSICNWGNGDSGNEMGFFLNSVPKSAHMITEFPYEKPRVLNPQFGFLVNDSLPFQNSGSYVPLLGCNQLVDHTKPHNSQIMALRDQLVKVSEIFQTGNFSLAQVILARLNHQLSVSGNPLVRAATSYVKDEIERLLSMNSFSASPPQPQPKSLTVSDVVNKMNAYKLFSEASPVMQFVEFSTTQALIEALDDADYIHILDFDIGYGSQWASFIRELPMRKRGAPFLKITAFTSSFTHHPFELALVCDNILEFAKEFGVSVDFQVMNVDSFDPLNFQFPEHNVAVAVNFPLWACSHCPFVLSQLLSFIKQCSPKIMISFDRGYDRCDLSFPSHIIRALDKCSNMLDSLHGLSVTLDTSNKIRNFLIEPTIERVILGRICAPDKMHTNKAHQWKNLFTSAGFVPLPFSNLSESQADLVVRRFPGSGFQVERRQASLVLGWMSHELMVASAWKC